MVDRNIGSYVVLQFISGGSFLSRLSSFPVDWLNEETVELLQVYLQSQDFELELVERTCGTLVTGLYTWTHALCSFHRVNKHVIHTRVD